MKKGRILGTGWLVAAALAAPLTMPAEAEAQHAMPELTRVDAAEPAAQRAQGLLDLLLAGEGEKAKAYLKEHTAPGDLGRVSGELEGIAPVVAQGFRLRDLVRAPDHDDIVFARLVGATGQTEIVGVRISNDAPHHILGLLRVQMQMGTR